MPRVVKHRSVYCKFGVPDLQSSSSWSAYCTASQVLKQVSGLCCGAVHFAILGQGFGDQHKLHAAYSLVKLWMLCLASHPLHGSILLPCQNPSPEPLSLLRFLPRRPLQHDP